MPFTTTEIVDKLKELLEAKVAPEITLKKAFDDNAKKVEWAHPAVYAGCLPLIGELPSSSVRMTAPSITVMPLDSTEDDNRKTQMIRVLCCTWNPGERTGIDADSTATSIDRNSMGWRDNLLVQEHIKRALTAEQTPAGMQLVWPIKSGIFNRREDTPDYYPYWWGWVDFSLSTPTFLPTVRATLDGGNFLGLS